MTIKTQDSIPLHRYKCKRDGKSKMIKVDEHPYNDDDDDDNSGGGNDANIDCSIGGTLQELILNHLIATCMKQSLGVMLCFLCGNFPQRFAVIE